MLSGYDPEVGSPFDSESESDDMFGGGTLRLAFKGGSLTNRSIRSWPIAFALSSVKPGLRSPLTEDENEDMRRVACLARQ